MTTEERVRRVIHEHLAIPEEKITPTSSFVDDLGTDSLDHVELVMAFEEEFGIDISDAEAEKVLTPGDAVALINSKGK